MITAREIYEETAILLAIGGYGENLKDSDSFLKDFLCCINKVIVDLDANNKGIKTLNDEINLPLSAKDTLCSGTAMWLALLLGDETKHNFFVSVYNSMRTKYKTTTKTITDVLPR